MPRHYKVDRIRGVDKKVYELPRGVRSVDIKNMTNEDSDVLLELAIYGRRTRFWFAKRDLLNVVRRLKSRGFVKSVCLKGHYSYDLTDVGYFCVRKFLV